MKKVGLVMIMLVLVSLGLYAEEPKVILEAGVGAMYDSGIYKDSKNRIEPLPLINARYEMFAIEFDRIKCYLNEDFALVVAMGRNGYDNIKGVSNKDMAIAAGVDYRIRLFDEFSTRIKVNENFFGDKNGINAELTLEKEFMLSEGDFGSLACGAEYIDDSMSNYYFGVKDTEATSSRKSYKAKGTFVPQLRFDYMKILTPNIYLIMSNKAELYLKEVTDSPLVDRSFNFNSLVGIVYKFM